MTKRQIETLLERVGAWPQEAQEELLRSSMDIERKHVGKYYLDDGERADIREGLAEIERGEVASDEEVQKTFKKLRNA
ncbi:MAG TPA: hypothetical protein VJL57_03205 [Candidatus Paceibacterota bacterium]